MVLRIKRDNCFNILKAFSNIKLPNEIRIRQIRSRLNTGEKTIWGVRGYVPSLQDRLKIFKYRGNNKKKYLEWIRLFFISCSKDNTLLRELEKLKNNKDIIFKESDIEEIYESLEIVSRKKENI